MPDRAAALAEAEVLLAPYAEAGEPGVALLVLHHGRPLLTRGWGLASIESGTALSSVTRMQLASMSKQFTAAAFLVLQARGALSLDARIGSLTDAVAPSLAGFTLRQLLSMRGGLMEAGHMAWFATGDTHHRWRDDRNTLATAAALAHRNRTPGVRDLYSNTHYVLAQQVGEAVTGMPWAQVLRELIFEPLGMTQTRMVTSAREASPALAMAYRPSRDGFERCAWPVQDGAASGVVSTLADLGRWHRNLRRNRLQPADLVEQLLHDTPFADGEGSCYRLGLREGRLFGRRVVGHAGSVPGFKTESYWFPEEDVSIVLIANREDVRETLVIRRIAAALLGESAGRESTPAELAAFEGLFLDASSGRVLHLEQDAGCMSGDNVHLMRSGDNEFSSTHPFFPRELRFSADRSALVSVAPAHTATLRRVQVVPVSADNAADLLGCYHQAGLPWPVTLAAGTDGSLVFLSGPDGPARSAWHAGRIDDDLYVLGDWPGGCSATSFRVLRNAHGGVRAIQVDGFRLWALLLERQ